jgi:FeS assembly SUF system regulator
MLRISKLTDYATLILAHLASQPVQRATAGQIASQTGLAAPTVSKLLKQLHRRGLVHSTRGLHGGYLLARPAAEITAANIIDALEGPVALTECAGRSSHCCIESTCLVGRAWQRVTQAIRRSLQDITLQELAGLGGTTASSGSLSPLDRGFPEALARFPARGAKREPL